MPFLAGTLGIAIRRGEIPGLRDFLLTIRPDNDTLSSQDNNLTCDLNTAYACLLIPLHQVKKFWEHIFRCKFVSAGMEVEGQTQERRCTGNELLRNIETEFLDLSNLRPEYNVYKAVYALAHALHDLLQCVPGSGPFKGQSCASLQGLEPWQILYYLQRVNFTTDFGDQVSFDENGDALPIYDVMNWRWLPDGSTEVKNVGEVKELASKIVDLILDEDKIFWNFESQKVCLPFVRDMFQ
ncbi:extracellular calcium-sensing receptor-like [Gadus chalcogrammus]|uniref:extracellular calcium-sensing receptor-like n=1 Tax=Gadus chalcogrammus TaxID=1042646 RepID=UPI0024C49B8B|nr:extracellular calcium-sensing receptor-like [Gadus chalcogrammus]